MKRGSRKRHIQLALDQARKPDGRHGGWRPGAGRPRKAGSVSHVARPEEPARYPHHVTLRIAEGVPSLARERFVKIIRAVVRASHKDAHGGRLYRAAAGAPRSRTHTAKAADDAAGAVMATAGAVMATAGAVMATAGAVMATAGAVIATAAEVATTAGFRIAEFNVLGNHLHLVVEASGKAALSRGVQGFCVSAARRLNSALIRKGKLFAHRYHARALRTPREVRNALRYVLLNRKHHDAEKAWGRYWIDPSSSAAWFDGWARPVRPDAPWKRELLEMARPTAPPQTWLLATGWKRHGLLRFEERPS